MLCNVDHQICSLKRSLQLILYISLNDSNLPLRIYFLTAVLQWLCVHGILMDQVLSAVIVTSVQLSGQTDTEVTFKLDGIAITSVLILNAHHLY